MVKFQFPHFSLFQSFFLGMSSYKNKHWGFMKDYIKKEEVLFVGEAGPVNNFKVAKGV